MYFQNKFTEQQELQLDCCYYINMNKKDRYFVRKEFTISFSNLFYFYKGHSKHIRYCILFCSAIFDYLNPYGYG